MKNANWTFKLIKRSGRFFWWEDDKLSLVAKELIWWIEVDEPSSADVRDDGLSS
jgi:hypothetical protein